MLLNSFADLLLLDGPVIKVAHSLTEAQDLRLGGEANILVALFTVDVVNDIAVVYLPV